MAQVTVEMDSDEARLFRAYQKLISEQAKMEAGLRRVGQAGRSAGRNVGRSIDRANRDAFGPRALSMLKGYAGGIASVGSAVAAAVRTYEVWLRNTRELASETRKLGNEAIAFAALQEGGTRAERLREVMGAATQFGVTDRGEALDVVQALQSGLGSFNAGLDAARTVFAASLAGIPVQVGKELEALGVAQGAAPGEFLRGAFIAGQASARDPATIARAGPGLVQFADKQVGLAVAGALAGTFGRELKTFLQAAGIALSDTGALARAREGERSTFEKLGVLGAGPVEKLRALQAAGITTPEDLARAGVTEITRQQALAVLLQNIPLVEDIRQEIRRRDRPGLFQRQRQDIEVELPEARFARAAAQLEAMGAELQATAPDRLEAAREIQERQIRAIALEAMGLRQIGPFDLVKRGESGRLEAGPLAEFLLAISGRGQRLVALAGDRLESANPEGALPRALFSAQRPEGQLSLPEVMDLVRHELARPVGERGAPIRDVIRRAREEALLGGGRTSVDRLEPSQSDGAPAADRVQPHPAVPEPESRLVREDLAQMREELQETTQQIRQMRESALSAGDALDRVAERSGGGAGFVPPNVDR